MKQLNLARIATAVVASLCIMEASAGIPPITPIKHRVNTQKLCRNYSICRNMTSYGRDLCQKCQSEADKNEKKRINEAAKRTAQIKVKKLELPQDAKDYAGRPIKSECRITSLCGYEPGKIAPKVSRPTVDDNGNIIVTEKLKKPFRMCNRATLRYSAKNSALYSIRLFSDPQSKLDENAAWEELTLMTEAFNAKFGDRISKWHGSKVFKQSDAQFSGISGQKVIAKMIQKDVPQRAALKGTAEKTGWELSLTLEDDFIKTASLDDADAEPKHDMTGADAL